MRPTVSQGPNHSMSNVSGRALASACLACDQTPSSGFSRLQKEIGFALLYVTHDREEAFDIGTRVVIMRQCRIDRIGTVGGINDYFAKLLSEAADEQPNRQTHQRPQPESVQHQPGSRPHII